MNAAVSRRVQRGRRLFAAALATLTLSASAVAQVKPAYVKNVDEVGRVPYEAWMQFSPSTCGVNCSNFQSFNGKVFTIAAPAPPAGKRLVIEQISALVPAGDIYNQVSLHSMVRADLDYAKWLYFGPFYRLSPTADFYGMTAPVYATYGPYEAPKIRIGVNSPINGLASITISGYLIDANN